MSVSRVKILQETVARKIAAGEVIDRPYSLVRELLDNAIDSGANLIQVWIEGGGVGAVRVQDNGLGMSREDMDLCWLPHATSKIVTDEDLERIGTLGFRGEALAAIAASSRLRILSSETDSGLAHELTLNEGQNPRLVPASGKKGTIVSAEEIFYFTPARRRFLKSPASEGNMCRRVFIDKALAFPELSFQLYMDGTLRYSLSPQSLKQRILQLEGEPGMEALAQEFQGSSEGFKIEGLSLGAEISRRDRSGIQIFVNKRKVQEFALVQAVTHAYGEYLPGGRFPVVWVFIQVEPHLLDFNIHPAKKEVRFRNLSQIHSSLVAALQNRLVTERIHYNSPPTLPLTPFPGGFNATNSASSSTWERPQENLSFQEAYSQAHLRNTLQEKALEETQKAPQGPFRYLGQLMKVFLLIEIDDSLMLIDQHAAHERILFNQHLLNAGAIQRLLIPLDFCVEESRAQALIPLLPQLKALGIDVRLQKKQEFLLKGIPQSYGSMASEIVELLTKTDPSLRDLERTLFAGLSCRAAIKEGDDLDPETAQNLIRQTLQLSNARCPHGRPIWRIFTRNDFYLQFGRLV